MQCERKLGILSFDRRCTKSLHVFRTFSVDKKSKHVTLKGLQQQNHPASSLGSGLLPCGPGVLHLLCLTALWGQQRVWWEWMMSSGFSFCVNDLENRVLSLHWKQNQLSLVHEGPLSIAESPFFIKLWIQCSRYTAWVFTEDRRDGLQPMRGERHKGREGHAPYRYLQERPRRLH